MNICVGDIYTVSAFDLKTHEYVRKAVKVVDILDGPGADRRDYCTIEGIYDWEVDMPLENFVKMVKETV